MNLETQLEPRLWESIRESIEARKFTTAILEGIHLLSEVIRERSGLEGDGVQLVGDAFGGNAPKLKVNRLQTESEQNEQRGIEALLRGMYQAIRNPRSHGTVQDEERNAVAILLFMDYLLRVIDRSRSPFSLPTFAAKVFDQDFAPIERYAELLVNEIPVNKRLATCREVFSRRKDGDMAKLKYFFAAVLAAMSSEDTNEVCQMLSEELQQTDDEDTIRFVLGAFPNDVWPRLSEIARLRIEHKLIQSVREGKYAKSLTRCTAGALGTWATKIIYHFTLKEELWRALCERLRSSDRAGQDFVFQFFLMYVKSCFEAPPSTLVSAVKQGLSNGDTRFKDYVELWSVEDFAGTRGPDDPWIKPFAEALAKFAPKPETPEITDDDIPF